MKSSIVKSAHSWCRGTPKSTNIHFIGFVSLIFPFWVFCGERGKTVRSKYCLNHLHGYSCSGMAIWSVFHSRVGQLWLFAPIHRWMGILKNWTPDLPGSNLLFPQLPGIQLAILLGQWFSTELSTGMTRGEFKNDHFLSSTPRGYEWINWGCSQIEHPEFFNSPSTFNVLSGWHIAGLPFAHPQSSSMSLLKGCGILLIL